MPESLFASGAGCLVTRSRPPIKNPLHVVRKTAIVKTVVEVAAAVIALTVIGIVTVAVANGVVNAANGAIDRSVSAANAARVAVIVIATGTSPRVPRVRQAAQQAATYPRWQRGPQHPKAVRKAASSARVPRKARVARAMRAAAAVIVTAIAIVIGRLQRQRQRAQALVRRSPAMTLSGVSRSQTPLWALMPHRRRKAKAVKAAHAAVVVAVDGVGVADKAVTEARTRAMPIPLTICRPATWMTRSAMSRTPAIPRV